MPADVVVIHIERAVDDRGSDLEHQMRYHGAFTPRARLTPYQLAWDSHLDRSEIGGGYGGKSRRVSVGQQAGGDRRHDRPSTVTLVTAAIVLWNTVYLGRTLDTLRRRGDVVPDALPAHIAPLGWQHINLTGDYLWDADTEIRPDGLRALRGADTITTQATSFYALFRLP